MTKKESNQTHPLVTSRSSLAPPQSSGETRTRLRPTGPAFIAQIEESERCANKLRFLENPDLGQQDLLVQKSMREVEIAHLVNERPGSVSSFENPSSELSTTSDSEERNAKGIDFDEYQMRTSRF